MTLFILGFLTGGAVLGAVCFLVGAFGGYAEGVEDGVASQLDQSAWDKQQAKG